MVLSILKHPSPPVKTVLRIALHHTSAVLIMLKAVMGSLDADQGMVSLQIAADNAIFGQTGPKVGSFDAGYGSTQMVRLIGGHTFCVRLTVHAGPLSC